MQMSSCIDAADPYRPWTKTSGSMAWVSILRSLMVMISCTFNLGCRRSMIQRAIFLAQVGCEWRWRPDSTPRSPTPATAPWRTPAAARPRRWALEADVVDMKTQVHELAIQMQERRVAVQRQGRRELDHTDQHQRRDFTGRARHRQNQTGHHRRTGHRQHRPPQGLGLGRAQRQTAFADRLGDARQDLPRWRQSPPAR